jgi:GntR family transcriptional repressor for pyruvate dehydrogenase complex
VDAPITLVSIVEPPLKIANREARRKFHGRGGRPALKAAAAASTLGKATAAASFDPKRSFSGLSGRSRAGATVDPHPRRRGVRLEMSAQASPPRTAASFETIRTVRTFETAIEHIVEGLERARLRRGDRLPNEAQLAHELGISKPTLRQALLVLQRAGLLDVRLGKTGGVFVASDLVPTDAISTAVALEERSVIDVLQGRRVIETAVVKCATETADASDYAELERSIELVRSNLGDRLAVLSADAMFHRVLVRACRNETMRAAMRVVERRLAPVRDAYSGGLYWDARVVDVHSRQVAAMRARDFPRLETVLDEHFRMFEEAYCAALGTDWASLFG